MRVIYVHMCVCVHMAHIYTNLRWPEQDSGFPGAGVKSGCEPLKWVLGIELQPSRALSALATESALQPTRLNFQRRP